MAERAHGRGIELTGTIQSDMPTQLRGDPGRLRQILFISLGTPSNLQRKVRSLSVRFQEHPTG